MDLFKDGGLMAGSLWPPKALILLYHYLCFNPINVYFIHLFS